jgi:hypothetical protein
MDSTGTFLRKSLIFNLCFLLLTPRDAFLKSSLSLIATSRIGIQNRSTITFKNAVSIIAKNTPRKFLDAVSSAGGKPLYRGEGEIECMLMKPDPDLLLPDTYADAQALEYFRGLEKFLTEIESTRTNQDENANGVFVAKPSTGHIATPSSEEARNWGVPMTVWPIGKEFSFVYPTQRKLFYHDSTTTTPLYTREDLEVNSNLKEALVRGNEVMFATRDIFGSISSAYIAVPEVYSRKLLSALKLI